MRLDLYAAFLPCLTFAHLARCAAAIFFRDAADIVRLGCISTTLFDALLAHRAFCARLIFLRTAVDIFLLGSV